MPLAVIAHGHDAVGEVGICLGGSLGVWLAALMFSAFSGEEEAGKADESRHAAQPQQEGGGLFYVFAAEKQEQGSC